MTWLLLLALGASAATTCGDHERLTTEAMLGLLADEEVACLEKLLHDEPAPRAELTWRLLLVDALAKGKHHLWRKRLAAREAWREDIRAVDPARVGLEDLDCTNVDVYMANIRACHVRAKAREYREAVEGGAGPFGGGGPVDLSACEDVKAVAEAAEQGALTPAQGRCLMHHLHTVHDEEVEQAIVMILIEDALARGGDEGVDVLMEQILHSLDCGDPDVYLENERSCDVLRERITSPREEGDSAGEE